jgi:O-antigen ligase
MLALLSIVIVAGRRRIGLVPSIVIAAGLFLAATALNFTGGREISATAGEDRTALWGAGLQLLKSHPLFGVGFDNMPDYAGQTAHNSVVVCAAELGSFGLFFWVLFVFSTVNDALRISSAKPQVVEVSAYRGVRPVLAGDTTAAAMSETEIHRFGNMVLLSLTGFLVAGWFLSRAFALTLFLLGGMAEVLYQKALEKDMVPPRMRLAYLMRYTGVFAVALILVMYISLRILNLMH